MDAPSSPAQGRQLLRGAARATSATSIGTGPPAGTRVLMRSVTPCARWTLTAVDRSARRCSATRGNDRLAPAIGPPVTWRVVAPSHELPSRLSHREDVVGEAARSASFPCARPVAMAHIQVCRRHSSIQPIVDAA
jgi:hypothetical protein